MVAEQVKEGMRLRAALEVGVVVQEEQVQLVQQELEVMADFRIFQALHKGIVLVEEEQKAVTMLMMVIMQSTGEGEGGVVTTPTLLHLLEEARYLALEVEAQVGLAQLATPVEMVVLGVLTL
jgi:hypothetical protein